MSAEPPTQIWDEVFSTLDHDVEKRDNAEGWYTAKEIAKILGAPLESRRLRNRLDQMVERKEVETRESTRLDKLGRKHRVSVFKFVGELPTMKPLSTESEPKEAPDESEHQSRGDPPTYIRPPKDRRNI